MGPNSTRRQSAELVRRSIAHAARRFDRPELLAMVYRDARRDLREDVARPVLLMAALRHSSSFVDVGAHEGLWLRHALRFAPNGRHVAFEPIPVLAESLAVDFPMIDVRQIALSDSAGQAEFCMFPDAPGWSGLRRRPEVTGNPTWLRVAVSRLDDELDKQKPEVLKIDVEGAELQVLRGAQDLLSEHRPLIILEHEPKASALFSSSSSDLWEFFRTHGYRLFTATGTGPLDRPGFERAAAEAVANDWLGIPGPAIRP